MRLAGCAAAGFGGRLRTSRELRRERKGVEYKGKPSLSIAIDTALLSTMSSIKLVLIVSYAFIRDRAKIGVGTQTTISTFNLRR